ncbi:hypothetical protein DVR12_08115 [Chitinophaga silvatica]|uniref:Uncharacterized protein n=1 Tax=Chitinophaga silvatica TaxID=2282649 RepID=A0A3E1YC61_9BACT|nr:hypothetical protein [Chitinophaga silvatica]RFS23845.1 hypothetical protein DVR12_08115 [Chitinophaga silvatica]
MNKLPTTTLNEQVSAISIGQIILDDSNFLTLWGHILLDNGTWKSCDFVTTYEVMNTMLRYSLERHDSVQMMIVNKLETMCRVPDMIDLEAELGGVVIFDELMFQLKRPSLELEVYTENECYFIESVSQTCTNKASDTITPNDVAAALECCVQLLSDTYNLYLGYMEVELGDEAARKKAGLEDDNRFSMAYYAWQLHTSKG